MMITLGDKFWSKVDKTSSCWNWIGKPAYGYGRFRAKFVHRLSYCHYYSIDLDSLKGLEIHHTCRNKACVNPKHLQVMTHEEHIKQPDSGSSIMAAKTHCPQGHEYTKENT